MPDKKTRPLTAGTPQSGEDDGDSRAIGQVLEAERAAELAVKDCERQAARIVHSARNRAQAIARRTDARITLLHMRCSQRLAEQQRRLAGEGRVGQVDGAAAASADDACLQRAVDSLAATLIAPDTADS